MANLGCGRPLQGCDDDDDDDDDDDEDDEDDDDDNKLVWPAWAVGALSRGARRVHINRVCFHITFLGPVIEASGHLP